MEENINICCPGCDAVFEVPAELAGEVGECTECGTTFEIPTPDSVESGELNITETGSIQVQESSVTETTNTVKLSRTSIGMIPNVNSGFKVDIVQRQSTRTQPNLDPQVEDSSGKNKAKIYTKTPENLEKTKVNRPPAPPKPTHPPKPTKTKKKWWQFWK